MRKATILVILVLLVLASNKPILAVQKNITVTVNVLPYVEFTTPEDLRLEVLVNEDNSWSQPVYLKANCPVTVIVSSEGFKNLLDEYITYSIGGGSTQPGFNYTHSWPNGTVIYSGNFTVSWNGENGFVQDDWHTVEAGEYTDTITFTISYGG
jgi:hypothetical protein